MCKEKEKSCFIYVDCEIHECKKYKSCKKEEKSSLIDFNAELSGN
ncbi:MAG: hypothetical protein ACOCQR_03050 [bacterium]